VNLNPATANLRTLCALRSLVLIAQVSAAYYAGSVLGWMLPYLTLNLLFAALAFFAVFSWWRSFQTWPVTQLELFIHLCVDIAGFSAVLYFSGGANNPFISYLLVPLCISATTLSWSHTWILTGLSASVYTVLLFHYVPLAAIMPQHDHSAMSALPAPSLSALNIHILGMWANFVVSALLVTYFVFKMASALRKRDAELARSRERRLQDEQLLAVATLAAGTAHELGTPLSTMKVITEDLLDLDEGTDSRQDMVALSQQIDHCTNILKKLVSTARDFSNLEDEHVQLQRYVSELLDRWQLLRPGIDIKVELSQTCRELALKLDGTVSQALLNLLNNAADAEPHGLALSVTVQDEHLIFNIADRGDGQANINREAFSSSKQNGLGLGLRLSHATASRYGGHLNWTPRPGGGSEISLHLPLQRVSA
jgi:two-component system sensor histidine kinase RegB